MALSRLNGVILFRWIDWYWLWAIFCCHFNLKARPLEERSYLPVKSHYLQKQKSATSLCQLIFTSALSGSRARLEERWWAEVVNWMMRKLLFLGQNSDLQSEVCYTYRLKIVFFQPTLLYFLWQAGLWKWRQGMNTVLNGYLPSIHYFTCFIPKWCWCKVSSQCTHTSF